MKHVGFLCSNVYNYFYQKDVTEFGGVSWVYDIVKTLSELNLHTITCYVGDYGQQKELTLGNIILARSNINKPIKALNVLEQLARSGADLLVDFYASPRLLLLALLKKFYRIPFVFFVGHDMDVDGSYLDVENRFFYESYVWGLRQADRIICQTPWQAKTLRETYGLRAEVIISPYVQITLPLNLARKHVLWVGRSAYYKRPEYFLDLAESIPEEQFVMICNPSRYDKGQHANLRERASKIRNLNFIEAVPHQEIRPFFAQAKVLVNTSDCEGFPCTFIEAALEKTPMISLNVDPNGILSEHGAGICCNGDRAKLNDICRRLAKDDVARSEAGSRARDYAVEQHDMDKAIKRVIRIFDVVMSK